MCLGYGDKNIHRNYMHVSGAPQDLVFHILTTRGGLEPGLVGFPSARTSWLLATVITKTL